MVAFAQQPPAERPTLDALLTRAAWYLDYFVAQFENVVAEEVYVQDSSVLLQSFNPIFSGRGGMTAQRSAV